MSKLKKYWVVVHYEREIEAEDELDAHLNTYMGDTIMRNATFLAQEFDEDTDLTTSITKQRVEVRKQTAISIIVHQLYHKIQDCSLISKGLPQDILDKVNSLSLQDLENLSIKILTINDMDELKNYLNLGGFQEKIYPSCE